MRVTWQTATHSITTFRTALFTTALSAALLLPMFYNPGIVHADSVVQYGTTWLGGGGVDIMTGGDGSHNCVSVSGAPAQSQCSNVAGKVYAGDKWQCVEMVNRLYLTKGWTTTTWWGNGSSMINDLPNHPGLTDQLQDHISYVNPGDVVTEIHSTDGHAGVINSVDADGTIHIKSQNADLDSQASITSGSLAAGTAHYALSGWVGYSIQAVIHHPTTGTTYPDGTYLHATDSGGIYVVAGGAAMYVSSWANVGGSHPYTNTTQAVINSMPTYPRDGTYIHAYTTGGIYVVAGGAPMYVSSWANVGGSHPTTDVDAWVITNQLRQYPLDGTYIHAYTTGGIYVVAGGAPMYVSSWANVGGTHPTTDVDVWVIANQLRQYPLNGTYIRAYTTGGVYVVAGGAPMYVSSWTTVGGTHPDTDVDAWVLTNQLRQHPSDGTYVQPYGNAAIYEAAGGAALSVSTWSAVGGPYPVTVIPSDSLPQFLSYPQDSTYVKGYQSGEEFEAMSGAVTRITTTPLPPATSVDDWAIINQLGGIE